MSSVLCFSRAAVHCRILLLMPATATRLFQGKSNIPVHVWGWRNRDIFGKIDGKLQLLALVGNDLLDGFKDMALMGSCFLAQQAYDPIKVRA